jgi:hypothetical protein
VLEALLAAAAVPAAATAGLTQELVGAFMSLLDTLPPQEQAVKVGRWLAGWRGWGRSVLCAWLWLAWLRFALQLAQ